MFSAFFNSIKIKELRSKLLFTAGVVVLCRVIANIPCPGVDPQALSNYFAENAGDGGGVMGMFNLFSGGALQKFAVGTLGIMPYISASIIMQLLMPVIPSLEKMVRETESGRQKFNQYTRYLTVAICVVQGSMAAAAMANPGRLGLPTPSVPLVIDSGPLFIALTVVVLTAGTMILMWLGEQITERGIGNGISLIITINIVARAPAAVMALYNLVEGGGANGIRFRAVHLLILLLVFALVTAATVALTQGQRRIPIQMARRMVGFNKMKGGTTYMPLKVNYSGVMPIIFAQAILMFPPIVCGWVPFLRGFAAYFQYGTGSYMVIYTITILLFSFFWVANQFNPLQIADNLKKEGAFIPGVRPGKPTAEFLDHTMSRITLAGALFLAALAIFPMILFNVYKIDFVIASFFGGTSLIIIVGVTLDTLSQMESHLTMRNYDGFLKRGKLRGRGGK